MAMSKLTAIVLTAAICLPLGALLQGSASADRRKNSLPGDVAVRHRRLLSGGNYNVDGHRHLSRAQNALHEAVAAIETSQRDNEAVWSDTSGRASAMRDAIERIEQAVQTIDRTAAWVNGGAFTNDARAR
jgi:chromosome segregation ATPase